MGRITPKPQTYVFGNGILILPNGDELIVKEMTITMGDKMELIQNGEVIREEPIPGSPVRITVR